MRAPSNLQVWLFSTALILGLIATVLINASLKNAVETASGGHLKPVVVAKRLLEPGARISDKDIEVKRIPSQHVPSRAVPANQQFLIANKLSSLPTQKGDILTWDAISQTPLSALSDQLGVMERAVTLNVDNQNSFNGLIKPGDRVDIMRLYDDLQSDESAQMKLDMLLENIVILAVNNQISRTLALSPEADLTDVVHTITVKVSPQEAAALAFAQAEGRIAFALRNPSDVFSSDVNEISGPKPQQVTWNQATPQPSTQEVSTQDIASSATDEVIPSIENYADAQPEPQLIAAPEPATTITMLNEEAGDITPFLELEPELAHIPAQANFDVRIQSFTQIN